MIQPWQDTEQMRQKILVTFQTLVISAMPVTVISQQKVDLCFRAHPEQRKCAAASRTSWRRRGRLLQLSERDEMKARLTFSKSAKDKNNFIFNMFLNCRKWSRGSLFTRTSEVKVTVRITWSSLASRLCV